ncbi:MAG: glycoside hydrolase family 2 protein [Pirellulales bacterium]
MLALEPLDFHPEPGQWYALRLVVAGPYIEVYLGDETRPRVRVSDSSPLPAGKVVLGGGWIATEFDDLEVELLPKDARKRLFSPFHANAHKINFQPTLETLVPGWLPANDRAYDKDRGYGWTKAVKEGTRQRGSTHPPLNDTLAVVAHGQNEATFCYDVANGEYVLSVCGGDPTYPTHFEAQIPAETQSFAREELPAGIFTIMTRPVVVRDGQFRIVFRSNHPHGQAGGSICYLALESRADVPDKWNSARDPHRKPAAVAVEKEKRRAEKRADYRPVAIDSLPNRRCVFSLSGDWLFKPEYELPADARPFLSETSDRDWHVIDVPDFWNPTINWLYGQPNEGLPHGGTGVSDNYRQREKARCDNYTFDWVKTQSAWYRQWFTLPDDLGSRQFTIRFDAVSKVADVWVNGRHAGGHVGMFGSFDLDVTEFVRPGKNLVAARVAIRKSPASKSADKVVGVAVTVEITEDMLNSLPHAIYGHQGGIWQPVSLMVTRPMRIDDVFARTRMDGAEIDVTVGNHGATAERAEVRAIVRPLNGGEPVFESPEPAAIRLEPGETSTSTLKTGKLAVKRWSPETPNLYTLTVTLVRSGTIVDRTDTAIGFRTFEVRDGAFYLNGKPYWLRGASHTPAGLAPNDARLANRFLKFMHDGNQMVTRDVCAPMSPPWLDAADRQGVGVSHEGPWPWLMSGGIPSQELLELWRDEQAALVRQNRNHPSLLMYTMNNEMFFTHHAGSAKRVEKWKELDTTIRMVRELDPTRPIVASSSYVRNHADWEKTLKPAGIDDGDVDDRHSYYGWYEGTHFKLFDGLWVRPGYGTTGINADRPYISQECSTGYPNNDTGHPTRSYLFKHYTPQAFVGPWAYEDHDPMVFLENRALVTKEVGEAIRRTAPAADGVLHFANICWFRNVYDPDRIEPYPTYHAMKLALQPVLVSAELFGRNYYAGDKIPARVCIVNDATHGRALPATELAWRICHGSEVLSQGCLAVPPVEHCGRHWLDAAFQLPKTLPSPRTDCQLRLLLSRGDDVLSENSYDLTLATEEWTRVELGDKSVGLYAGDPSLGKLLEAMHIECRQVSGVTDARPDQLDLLITGGFDHLESPPADWPALRKFAEAGGVALILHGGKHVRTLLPECVEAVLEERGEIVSMRVPEAACFDAIEPPDLSWWNVEAGKIPYACRRSFRLKDAANIEALATYLRVHWYLSNPPEQLKGVSGSPLFQVTLGKGRIVVCEMELGAAAGDPLAGRLLRNLITSLAN